MKKLFQKKEKTNDYYIITPKKPSSSSYGTGASNATATGTATGTGIHQVGAPPQTPPITPSPPTSPSESASTQEHYLQKLYQQQLAHILSPSSLSSNLPISPSNNSTMKSDNRDSSEQNFIFSSILGCGSDTSYLANSATSGSVTPSSSFTQQQQQQKQQQQQSYIHVPSMMWQSRKDGLSTILEEGVALWGMAPSDDSEEDNNSVTLNQNHHYSNINHICHQQDGTAEASASAGAAGAGYECILEHEQGVMKGENPEIMNQYCQSCAVVNPNQDNTSTTNTASATTSYTNIKNNNKKNQESKKKKQNLMIRSLSNLTNRSIKKTNKSKSKSQLNNDKTNKKSKKGQWKCAKDEKTDRIYYYHTLTREVSWERPSSFQEWKATLDPNTKRYYYYNVITKETTWDQPSNFVVWRKVQGGEHGDYYYNVLTKETRWDDPLNRTTVGLKKEEDKDITMDKRLEDVTTTERLEEDLQPKQRYDHQKHDLLMDKERLEKQIGITTVKQTMSLFSRREEEIDESNAEENVIILPPRTEVSQSFKSGESFEEESTEIVNDNKSDVVQEPGQIVRSSDHDILKRLLMKHCPEETELNYQLLSKAHGKENLIAKGLENLIAETPYDALRLTIFSFVKETLRGMGEQPYDEVSNFEKKSRMRSDFVPMTSKSSYSMNNKMLSTMTGVSNATEAVNNTSAARMNSSLPYSIIAGGKSNVSTATQQMDNTSGRKKTETTIERSKSDRNNLLANLELGEKDSVGYSLGSLTETEEEDLTLNRESAVSNMKSVESSKSDLLHKTGNQKEDIFKADDMLQVYNGSRNRDSKNSGKRHDHTKDDESAYAADNDDRSDDDYSYGDQASDDISALSEESPQRRRKKKGKKKSAEKKARSKKEKKRSSEEHRNDVPPETGSWKIDTSWNSVSNFIASVENSIQKSINASDNDSIGYEELPRAKPTVQTPNVQITQITRVKDGLPTDWDDDTLSSNFNSDNDNAK